MSLPNCLSLLPKRCRQAIFPANAFLEVHILMRSMVFTSIIVTTLLITTGCGSGPDPDEEYEENLEDIAEQRNPDNASDWDEVFDGVTFPSESGDEVNNDGPKPVGHLAYQPPIIPITISIDSEWNFKVSAEKRFYTPFGEVEVSAGEVISLEDDTSVAPDPLATTILVVCRDGKDKNRCEGFEIRSGRKLEFATDGAVKGVVEQDLMELHAGPDTTIEIFDAGPSDKPATSSQRVDIERSHLHDQSKDVEIDLERRQSGTLADLSYDRMADGDHNKLKPVNGAKVVVYGLHNGYQAWVGEDGTPTHEDFPAPEDCTGMEAKEWSDSFKPDDIRWGLIFACVITGEGDIGYVLIAPVDTKPTSFYIYSYVWVY